MTPDRVPPSSTPPLSTEVVHLGDDDPADLSFPATAGFILRHLRLLTLTPFFLGALGMVFGLLFGRAYTATSQFVPEGGSDGGLGRYSALAAQVGFSLPGGASGQSPDFYAALVKAPETLRRLAESRFVFEDGDERIDATFVELSGIERPTLHRTMLGVIKLLDSQVRVAADPVTGVVEIETVAKWLPLSEQLNRRLLDLVGEFNDERRRRIASAEREFVEGRLSAVAAEVGVAEAGLQRFLAQNRNYQSAPQLVLAADRLRRELMLRQQVYTGLAQALETARIEEVRNTPQITILTRPEGTADRPRLLRSILGGALFGALVAVLAAFAMEWLRWDVARRPADYAELRGLRWRDLYARVVGRSGADRERGA